MGEGGKQAAVERIKMKIRLLNWVSLLMLYIILLLIARFMYSFLEYIPMKSAVTMMFVMFGLVLIGFYLARFISSNAIRAIEDYSGKLRGLLAATRDLHGTPHSDVLLKSILDRSIEMTGADGGSLLLREGNSLVFKTVRGAGSDSLAGHEIPVSQGIAGWVVESGGVARVDDANKDGRFYPGVDRLTGFETRSVMCLPLRHNSGHNSGVVGALELVSNAPKAFRAEDEEIISYLAEQAAISLERAKFYEDERNYEIHLTNILSGINDRIAEKRGHSKRVAKYALLMADAINLAEEKKRTLYKASLLHDIGFLNMSLDEAVSANDFKPHSRIGYEMLKPINFYASIAPIVLHHHERWDGRGYPAGLKRQAIPLESRMIAIAEAFDAMVSRDSYKVKGKLFDFDRLQSTVGLVEALEELKANAGTQFDPELVKVFITNISEDAIE